MLFSPRRQLELVVRFEGRILSRTLIRRGRYVIGQDRKNEIVVDQDSISSRHARLTVVTETEIFIEDFGSANGTFVDGNHAAGLVPLTFESKVELGQCTLEFQRAGLPAAVFGHMPNGFLRSQRYQFGEIVVQGRTSTIYEAHDTALNRDIALKMMLPESQENPANVLRFIREAQITSQLQHPNIPPIYELSIDDDGHLYYTTRFVEGDTLASVLTGLQMANEEIRQRFPLSALISIFEKVCDGIAFAHAHGVIHSAITPDNITIGTYGEVFVMGWAYATLLPEPPDITADEARIRVHAPEASGSAPLTAYSAPLQASATPVGVTEKVDIYALGGVLYKILFLQDPIVAQSETELVGRIMAGQITAPAAHARVARPHWPGGRLPDYLAAVAMRALSLAKEDRPSSVLSMQKKVHAWQQNSAITDDSHGHRKNNGGVLAAH